MDIIHRPSSGSRREALARLRTLTAGVAVTGIAATAGFGFMAASGTHGTSNESPTSAGGTASGRGTGSNRNAAPTPAPQPATEPQAGDGFQLPLFNSGNQAPAAGSGRSHATTGGSG